jgi:hypothetical protein
MPIRASLAVFLVAVSRLAAADASLPEAGGRPEARAVEPGTYRGQLELHFTMREGGVGYHQSSEYKLALELTLTPAGSGTLKAHGVLRWSSAFLEPTGPARAQSDQVEINDTAKVERSGGRLRVRLEQNRPEQIFECGRERVTVEEKSIAVLRCRPLTTYTGMPWSDPLPPWLRAPLVFAVDGNVCAQVLSEPKSASTVRLSRQCYGL